MLPCTHEKAVELARAFAPRILFDANEPFFPAHVGITVFPHSGRSPSCDHFVHLKGDAEYAIEYAIWWDWDIQHLYELEHIWVYVNSAGDVARVEASAHGRMRRMQTSDGELPLQNGRVTLYSEPGKHAFLADQAEVEPRKPALAACCGTLAGKMDILIQPRFKEALADIKPYELWLARQFMVSKSFTPSFDFDQAFDLADIDMCSWPDLAQRIPKRIFAALEDLRANHRGLKAVFLDSGDTLIDEGSEVKFGELVLEAQTIPGTDALMQGLKERGVLVALVADGLVESFDRVHGALGLTKHFHVRSISEAVGSEKPLRQMFDAAAEMLGLRQEDYDDIIMVGNNLSRDISGANALGMKTAFIPWAPRRSKEPANELEIPDYTIEGPADLLAIIDSYS